MTNRLCGCLLALAGLATSAATPAARAQESAAKPLAVVALSGYDALMGDIDFLGSLAGMPGASQFVEMGLMQATQNRGLAGMDKAKPLGLIVQAGEFGSFSGMLCLPVNDLGAMLEVLAPFGVASQDAGNGMRQISANGQNVFARQQGEWTYLSIMPNMLEELPADPGGQLAELTKEYDVAVQLHLTNIPEAFKQIALDAISSGANETLEQNEGESDAAFAVRKEQLTLQIEQLKRSFNEMDEVVLGVSVDGAQQRTYIDVTTTAIEGTKLAEDFALNANPQTNFSGFIQPDAAMMMSFSSKVSPADLVQVDQMLEAVRGQMSQAIDDESDLPSEEKKDQMKSAMGDMLDALKSTLQAGVMDGGAVMNMAPDAMTFVAGGFVSDPAKIEAGLKKLADLAADDEDFPGVSWNAETHAGVTFHTLSAPIDEDETEARQMLGEQVDIAVGLGANAVYLAVGRDCLQTAKAIIDQSQANPGQEVAPMEMSLSLGPIINMARSVADEEQKPQLALLDDMLQNETNGRDHVRISSTVIPRGQRTRIELEEGVLRAIGMAAMQGQMAGAGAGF